MKNLVDPNNLPQPCHEPEQMGIVACMRVNVNKEAVGNKEVIVTFANLDEDVFKIKERHGHGKETYIDVLCSSSQRLFKGLVTGLNNKSKM